MVSNIVRCMGKPHEKMTRSYWDKLAVAYKDDVFSSIHEDCSGTVVSALDTIADKKGAVCDVGCGVGHYTRALVSRFQNVSGLDFSIGLLEQARSAHGHLSNVTYYQVDLVEGNGDLQKHDALICMNVLISADSDMRASILRNISTLLKRLGRFVILVPSLESALWANRRLEEWNERPEADEGTALPRSAAGARQVLSGNVKIDGVQTKHYLREELQVFLDSAGLRTDTIEKVEYSWETEFENPPDWMRDPYPWDWLACGSKK
jgi:2-polyprenyl-3-methyl-5-hydroxy-6-metoxy-1,4-benzoquinol methylase